MIIDQVIEQAKIGISDIKEVESFIKNIYEEDPNFVERNMEEVLEDEVTRDE